MELLSWVPLLFGCLSVLQYRGATPSQTCQSVVEESVRWPSRTSVPGQFNLLTHSHNFFTTIQFEYICLLCYIMKVSWVTSVVPRCWIVGFVLKRKKELCILECPSISFLKIYFCKFDFTCMYLLALLCAGNSSGQHRASCDCLPLHPSSVPSRWDMSRGRHKSATSNGR